MLELWDANFNWILMGEGVKNSKKSRIGNLRIYQNSILSSYVPKEKKSGMIIKILSNSLYQHSFYLFQTFLKIFQP